MGITILFELSFPFNKFINKIVNITFFIDLIKLILQDSSLINVS